jgi:hypothetical protein
MKYLVLLMAMSMLCVSAATATADNPIGPPVTICKNFQYTKTSRGVLFKHVFHEVVLQVQMVTPLCFNGFTLAAKPSTCTVLQESRNVSVDGCNSTGVMGSYTSATDPQTGVSRNVGYHVQISFNATECVFFVHLICLPSRTVTLNEDFDALGNSHKSATNS